MWYFHNSKTDLSEGCWLCVDCAVLLVHADVGYWIELITYSCL